jgi:hypothetical protein
MWHSSTRPVQRMPSTAITLITGFALSPRLDKTLMRVLVKRILRKYGYPPDLRDVAVQTVLQQAEALSVEWATGSQLP